MRNEGERFRRNYAPVFLRYLSQRDESALRAAYELGRAAIGARLSILELVETHHAVLFDVVRESRSRDELEDVAAAASAFLVEVLSPFEMTQRGFLEVQQEARRLQRVLDQQEKHR